ATTMDPSRRMILRGAAGLAIGGITVMADAPSPVIRGGRINQSVCQWCYRQMPVEELARNAARIGLKGIDLVGPEHFTTLKKYNLVGTMTPSHSIPKGLNRIENHDECLAKIRAAIDATSGAGFPNVICFSGNRAGIDDEQGLQNCASAVKQVVA